MFIIKPDDLKNKTLQQLLNEAGEQHVHMEPGYFRGCATINNAKGLSITGSGINRTRWAADKPLSALELNGPWFGRLSQIEFCCEIPNPKGAVVSIDGGKPVGTDGTQGMVIDQCLINARSLHLAGNPDSLYALSINLRGGNEAQADMGRVENSYLFGGLFSSIYQRGYNALNNRYVGCNFQHYPKHGIYAVNGSLTVDDCGFQANRGALQIETQGFDIHSAAGGVYETISITNCRTESLQFAKIGAGQYANIQNNVQRKAIPDFRDDVKYVPGNYCTIIMKGLKVPPRMILIKCIKPHLGPMSIVQINWDNWVEVPVKVVEVMRGVVKNNDFEIGSEKLEHDIETWTREVDYSTEMYNDEKVIFVDCRKPAYKNNPVEICLPLAQGLPHGATVTVIKGDSLGNDKEHLVRIWGPFFCGIPGVKNESTHWYTLSVNNPSVKFIALGAGTLPRRWYKAP